MASNWLLDKAAQIAASIIEFGFTNPILAGSDGVIVAGHGRLAAAQKLGLDTLPVVVLDHLTPKTPGSLNRGSPLDVFHTRRDEKGGRRRYSSDDFDVLASFAS